MVAKSPDAFRTISEVAEDLGLPQHVLRFWETRFTQIKPLKRGGGRRYYRPDDVDLLRGIRFLLYSEGYTIRGVQRLLKEQGPRFVVDAGRGEFTGVPGRQNDGPEMDEADEAEETPDAAAQPPQVRREPTFARTETISSQPPRPPERREPAFDVEREDHDPDEEIDGVDDLAAEAGSARRMAERLMGQHRAGAPPRSAGLARDDADRLKATLAELLELKRLLDQAR